jgi:hypothetical protein
MMLGYKVWTCGQNVSRLKETTVLMPDGSYQLPSAEDVFRDYQHHTDRQPVLSVGQHVTEHVHSRR